MQTISEFALWALGGVGGVYAVWLAVYKLVEWRHGGVNKRLENQLAEKDEEIERLAPFEERFHDLTERYEHLANTNDALRARAPEGEQQVVLEDAEIQVLLKEAELPNAARDLTAARGQVAWDRLTELDFVWFNSLTDDSGATRLGRKWLMDSGYIK